MSDSLVAAPAADQESLQALSRRRVRTNKDFKQNNAAGYLFLSPWLIGFLLFGLIPIGLSLWLAFTNFDLLSTDQPKFVGLANFQEMFFQDIRYGRSLRATLSYVIISVPLKLAFALAIAVLLNNHRRSISLYRAAFYAPSVVGGSVAVAVMWRQIFGTDGIMNAIAAALGLPKTTWLGNSQTAIWTLIILAA